MNVSSNYHSSWVLYNVNKKVNEVLLTLQILSPVSQIKLNVLLFVQDVA